MGNHTNKLLSLFVMGCALGASTLSLPILAAGDGTIIIQRQVQPRSAVRPTGTPDPRPMTVNANQSPRILSQTNELSDGDFADVASGASVNRVLMPDASGNIRGMGAVPTSLPGLRGGAGPGAGGANSISNSVNQNVQRGLAPLQILTGGR